MHDDQTIRCWCCDAGYGAEVCNATPAGTFARVLVGGGNACAQRPDGSLTCWGFGWPDGEKGKQPVGAVGDFAMESSYDAALLPDGSIQWWGYGTQWDAVPPAVPFTDLSLGRQHACALDAAGTAYCWGDTTSGTGEDFPPPPAGTFAQVESWNDATCLIDADGWATCWWGIDIVALDLWAQQIPAVQFAQIGLGEWDGCGVDVTGQAWCWGGDPAQEPWLAVPDLN